MDRQKMAEIRVSLGLSQGALAREAGISRSYLSEIESGEKTPRMAVARSLAMALGVELKTLTEHST